ncbi:MAG TPA: GTPase Era [Acidimicrobiales bacterium]|nr:GTPase Era [Acidimicrobiales bacterium]
MRSGFATLVGRPNVGKSTLLNVILGTKVSIVSDKPQTTRTEVRGVLNRRGGDGGDITAQVVFVDTPGIHKPRTLMGERLNDVAMDALVEVDVACLLVEANAPIGKGDRYIASRLPRDRTFLVVNKVDAASRDDVLRHLAVASSDLDVAEYFPVSAKTGEGVPELVDAIVERMPEGPQYYPDDMVTDVPEAFWVAELVREQLLARVHEELPHSIATRVTEWEWPRVRCEILVERESQKGIVIGKGGSVLKDVGTAVRSQLPDGVYLELFVKVDKDWQRRPKALERLLGPGLGGSEY